MALVANDPKAAKRLGIPKSVGEEFMQADKGKKFKGGGMAKTCATKSDAKMIAKKEVKGHESSMHKMKKGGMTKGCGYASGGKVSQLSKANGIAKQGKTKGRII